MNIRNITTALLLFFIAQGCEQIIEVDLPEHEPKLTINSTLSPDAEWFVHLSSSIGILETGDPEDVQNGEVVIYQNGAVLDTFAHAGDGFYVPLQSIPDPQEGNSYEIRATAPGFEAVSSVATIPPQVTIDRAYTLPVLDANGNPGFTTELTVEFQDPPGENFYFVSLVNVDTFGIPPNQSVAYYNVFMESSDPALAAQPLYSNFEFNGLLFPDVSFEGQDKTLKFTAFEEVNSSRTYILILGSMSEDYYLYGRTYSQTWENDGNPFAEPVMIHSNVANGYGIFAGFNTFVLEL